MQRCLSILSLALLSVLGMLLGLLLSVAVVRAHALLVRSSPEAGAELVIAPATIELWFSEPLEPQFSQAYLVDAQGNELGRGTSTVDPADPMHLTLPLDQLTPGIYTVVYHNLSQADGHEWVGSFPLTLLNPDGTRSTAASGNGVSGDDLQGNELPSPLKAIGRWLALLGAMCLTGGSAFRQLALGTRQPKPPGTDGETAIATSELATIVERTVQVGLVFGMGAVFIGSWLQVMAQMVTLGAISGSGGAVLDGFFRTRAGSVIVTRQLLIGILLFVTIVAAGLSGKLRSVVQWVALPISLVVLATFSWSSHAAAVPGSGWAILGDFVHLVAAAVWLGGLLVLAVLLWQMRTQPAPADATRLRQVVGRFSVAATLAVFVLVVTGLFSSFVQLQSLALLWRTLYGWLLLGKVLLVLIALGIALLNHRLVRAQPDPALTLAWTETRYQPFLRQVWSESLLGLAIMVVVAFLVQTPVPPPVAPPPAATPAAPSFFETLLTADDLTIHLQISPNQVGDNRYVTHLYHTDRSAIGEVQLVRLIFVHQTADLGQATLELQAQGGDLFAGAGAYQNRAGAWDVSVYVRRRGMDDALTKTIVDVSAPVSPPVRVRDPWQNPIATLPAGVVVGGLIVALLLTPLLWWYARHGEDR